MELWEYKQIMCRSCDCKEKDCDLNIMRVELSNSYVVTKCAKYTILPSLANTRRKKRENNL